MSFLQGMILCDDEVWVGVVPHHRSARVPTLRRSPLCPGLSRGACQHVPRERHMTVLLPPVPCDLVWLHRGHGLGPLTRVPSFSSGLLFDCLTPILPNFANIASPARRFFVQGYPVFTVTITTSLTSRPRFGARTGRPLDPRPSGFTSIYVVGFDIRNIA